MSSQPSQKPVIRRSNNMSMSPACLSIANITNQIKINVLKNIIVINVHFLFSLLPLPFFQPLPLLPFSPQPFGCCTAPKNVRSPNGKHHHIQWYFTHRAKSNEAFQHIVRFVTWLFKVNYLNMHRPTTPTQPLHPPKKAVGKWNDVVRKLWQLSCDIMIMEWFILCALQTHTPPPCSLSPPPPL